MRNRCVFAAAGMILSALTAAAVFAPAKAQDASIGIDARHIYPSIDSARSDIDAAIAQAHRTHKRVIVDFGGDWCPDCQVLNIYFHRSPNAELLDKYFVRVNVNVGHMDANNDIAGKYGVPLKGVPALAVLDADGKALHAQNKEFSDMRHLDSSALTAFLTEWKH